MAAGTGDPSRARSGAAMIVGASATIQVSGALAHGLFAAIGPGGASALRFVLGASILLVAVRPAVRGRDARAWRAIALYGSSLALLNVTFFAAIDRIPMGIAVTLAFLGPLGLALARSRRPRDVALALLAGAGVALLGGVDRPASVAGVALAIACGVGWVGVALAGRAVGARTRGVDGLALALPVAALITLPLGVPHLAEVGGRVLALGLAIALVGLIAPFALELEGLRRLEPRAVAVIYSVDPAIAALAGRVLLGERISAVQAVGMAAVIAASIGVTLGAGDVA